MDFVIAEANALHLLEAQWTENPGPRDAQGVELVARILRERSQRTDVDTTIMCRTPHASALGDGTRVIELSEV